MRRRRIPAPWRRGLAGLLWVALATAAGADFVAFETGSVRPLALSADGTRLYAVNTPDNRARGLPGRPAGASTHIELRARRPRARCAVAEAPQRTRCGSSTTSPTASRIIDVVDQRRRVVRADAATSATSRNDIVFAGPSGARAFISDCPPRPEPHRRVHRRRRRGRRSPTTLTEGIGRGPTSGSSTPPAPAAPSGARRSRSCRSSPTRRARSPSSHDGDTVYVAAFHSGNQTTALPEASSATASIAGSVILRHPHAGSARATRLPGGLFGPDDNFAGASGAGDRPDREVRSRHRRRVAGHRWAATGTQRRPIFEPAGPRRLRGLRQCDTPRRQAAGATRSSTTWARSCSTWR